MQILVGGKVLWFDNQADYEAWVAERHATTAAKAKQIEAIATEGMVGLQAGADSE